MRRIVSQKWFCAFLLLIYIDLVTLRCQKLCRKTIIEEWKQAVTF